MTARYWVFFVHFNTRVESSRSIWFGWRGFRLVMFSNHSYIDGWAD
jgi:hypothetical protein